MDSMRSLVIMLVILFMTSCSTKYRGLHNDVSQFKEDVNYCLKKLCQSEIKSSFTEFSIISPAKAYGGGGDTRGSTAEACRAKSSHQATVPSGSSLPRGWIKCVRGYTVRTSGFMR